MRKTKHAFIQKIAVILIVILAFANVPVADASSVASAPLLVQAEAANGMVRVYLSSLGNSSSLTLTVVGNYSVNGNTSQSVSSGSNVTVGFNSATGALTLTQNGKVTNMGTSFALRRHSATGTNGIKIAQARMPANPYPGDISFQAIKSGASYKLYTIAHIYIENYLYGVLPYEMGNSSHIEALKAQAVAARTYTLRMMHSRSSGTYDVVDTTNDQVYNGTPSGNANCVAAVDATKGIVVKNGSEYTATYYSASNGGQMESIKNAWGTSGYDYLGVKDDPFDLANPDSVVKRYTVYESCASNGAALLSLLKTKAVSALKNKGYSATSDNTTLQTVKSITPHSPKYAAPSKLYTKLDFVLAAATKNGSGSAATVDVTVTCDIFSELESLLGMSIQSTANELWSVSKSGSNYVLEARRYGHGIGLSQRGAMYMGKQGYSYDQILGFYFDGCKRVRVSFTNTILDAGSSQVITTVEDPAEIEGESNAACTGVVKLAGTSASLAIRAEKSTSGKLLGVIANNSPVSVYANDGSWCFIRFGNIQGYVPTSALTLSGSAPASTEERATQISGFATVVCNGYLNLRSAGSISSNVITTAPAGSVFTVFDSSGGWAHIQFGATVAYASVDFLSMSAAYPGEVANTGEITATVALEDPYATVELRATPSSDGATLAQVPNGATVTVIRDDGAWCEVTYNGLTGYLLSACLTPEDGMVSGGAEETPAPEAGGMTAIVKTITASLYQEKNMSSQLLLEVPLGQSVVVLEAGSEWCKVRYEGVEGYVAASSLNLGTGGGTTGSAQMTAIVVTKQGSLNLRMSAGTGSAILTTIPRGAQVIVNWWGNVWSAVTYNGISGHVMTQYLGFLNGGTGSGNGDNQGTVMTAVVSTASGTLNLRMEGRLGSKILRTIPRYATVAVHTRDEEWSHVTYQGITGYVMTAFLSFVEASPLAASGEDTELEDIGSAEYVLYGDDGSIIEVSMPVTLATVSTDSGVLNLREEPSADGAVLLQIPQQATVSVNQLEEDWSDVTYKGQSGYVMTQFLRFDGLLNEAAQAEEAEGEGILVEEEQVQATPQEESSVQAQPEGAGTYTAWVVTPSGALNLREKPSMGAGVLTGIPWGADVRVLEEGEGWSRVEYGEWTGYVAVQYLSLTKPTDVAASSSLEQANPPTSAMADLGEEMDENLSKPSAQALTERVEPYTAWVVTPSGALNLREAPSKEAPILAGVPLGAAVLVVEESEGWRRVEYGEWTGYVAAGYVSRVKPTEAAVASPVKQASEPVSFVVGEAGASQAPPLLDATLKQVVKKTFALATPKEQKEKLLAMWEECDEQGSLLAGIVRGEQVQVLMRGETWCQVVYETQTGYCLTECLLFFGE